MEAKVTNPKTRKTVKYSKISKFLSDDYKTFEALEDKYPEIWDISENISDGKEITKEEENIYKRAFFLSNTEDLKLDIETVRDTIDTKLTKSCNNGIPDFEEKIVNWYLSEEVRGNIVQLFDNLYETFSLKTLDCIGI